MYICIWPLHCIVLQKVLIFAAFAPVPRHHSYRKGAVIPEGNPMVIGFPMKKSSNHLDLMSFNELKTWFISKTMPKSDLIFEPGF